jgi:hypothetical protein
LIASVPLSAQMQALPGMEPTEVNANRFAQLPGGWMSLNDAE